MKKRGFGQGRWNGSGGKMLPGETITQTARREVKEELGVKLKNLHHVATLDFYFPLVATARGLDQQVIVFLSDTWDGKICETAEMKPRWFRKNKLPLARMWSDDRFWVPAIFRGKFVKAEFALGKDDTVLEKKVLVYEAPSKEITS